MTRAGELIYNADADLKKIIVTNFSSMTLKKCQFSEWKTKYPQ